MKTLKMVIPPGDVAIKDEDGFFLYSRQDQKK
jgi:hypothetical protein